LSSGISGCAKTTLTPRTLSFPPSPSPSSSSSSFNSSADTSISRRVSFSARLYSSKHHPRELLDKSSTKTANSNDESEEAEFKASEMPSC
jgi:hypothetical protein